MVSPAPPEPPYLVAPYLLANSASITPVKNTTPVNNDHTSNKYPHLSQALGDEDGYFDPADPSVIKSMQGLLQEIKNLLSTKYELNLQTIASNRPIVTMPSQIQKNGLTPPSKSQDPSTGVHLNQHIELPITS